MAVWLSDRYVDLIIILEVVVAVKLLRFWDIWLINHVVTFPPPLSLSTVTIFLILYLCLFQLYLCAYSSVDMY